jgi:drug/metabolite transporter (DMT)-like permease
MGHTGSRPTCSAIVYNKPMSWIVSSIISALAFAGVSLLLKRLTQFSFSSEIINLYFWLTTSIAFFLFVIYKKTSFTVSKESWIWFLILALVAFVANYFSVEAIKLAPNPGYVRAIQASRIVLVTLLSVFLFQSEFTIRTLLGVIVIIGGVILITS